MKCPKCGKEGCKYVTRVSVTRQANPRTRRDYLVSDDKIAKCKKCGWTGVC